MEQQNRVLGTKYVHEFCGDYFDKPWYERNLIGYFDDLDYKDMWKDPSKYFENKKIVNFDIIYHECRGDPLQGTYKGYQTVKSNDLQKYTRFEKKRCSWGVNQEYQTKGFICWKEYCKGTF